MALLGQKINEHKIYLGGGPFWLVNVTSINQLLSNNGQNSNINKTLKGGLFKLGTIYTLSSSLFIDGALNIGFSQRKTFNDTLASDGTFISRAISFSYTSASISLNYQV